MEKFESTFRYPFTRNHQRRRAKLVFLLNGDGDGSTETKGYWLVRWNIKRKHTFLRGKKGSRFTTEGGRTQRSPTTVIVRTGGGFCRTEPRISQRKKKTR